MIEIAYLNSSFIRVVKINNRYEVQTKRFRGEGKIGNLIFWKTLYGTPNQDRAIKFMESYA